MKRCPFCIKPFNQLVEHHVIPREMTLNGIKGVNGPVVYICASCHTSLHSEALALTSKNPKVKQYFTEEERVRAFKYLRVLVAALQSNKEKKSSGHDQKLVLSLDSEIIDRLHILKTDFGFTNLTTFLEEIVCRFLRSNLLSIGSEKAPRNRRPPGIEAASKNKLQSATTKNPVADQKLEAKSAAKNPKGRKKWQRLLSANRPPSSKKKSSS